MVKPVLSGDVRILAHDTARVPHKTDRQAERKVATLRLCDKTSRQAASYRVRLKLGYGSLEAEKPASICASTIADAIPISDETLSQPRECRGEGVSRNSCGRDASRRLTRSAPPRRARRGQPVRSGPCDGWRMRCSGPDWRRSHRHRPHVIQAHRRAGTVRPKAEGFLDCLRPDAGLIVGCKRRPCASDASVGSIRTSRKAAARTAAISWTICRRSVGERIVRRPLGAVRMIDKTWHIQQVMQGIHVWFGEGHRGGRWLGRACRTKQRYAVADFNHARLQETAAAT